MKRHIRMPGPSDALNAAAFDPALWPQACQSVSAALGGASFALFRLDPEHRYMTAAPGHEGHMERYCAGQWWDQDLRGRRSLSAPPMTLLSDDDLVDPLERQNSDFYRDFAAGENVPFCLGWGFEHRGRRFFFSSMRSAALGPATVDDRFKLAGFMAQAAAAAQLSCALRDGQNAGLLEGLELAGEAALALDHSGRLIGSTSAAAPLLARCFQVASGQLGSSDKAADAALSRLRQHLLHRRGAEALTAFVIPGRSGRGVLCTPLLNGGDSLDVFSDIGAVLVLRDLSAASRVSPDVLKALFGLTPAEIEVARAIGDGVSRDALSRQRGVTAATTRTILAAVFRKTNTSRQSELAALIAKLS